MSAQEIIDELKHLSATELQAVDARIHELLGKTGKNSDVSWGEALLQVAGTAQGLPEDLAHNHDHYLHGTARK